MSSPDAEALRGQLRRGGRACRRAIPELERVVFDERIHQHLLEVVGRSSSPQVALYHPFDGEADPHRAAPDILSSGKAVVYARHRPGRSLEFAEAVSWRRTHRGLPIPEGPVVSLQPGALIIVPGTAFDLHGHRLGMGAGAYDRTLAEHPTAVPVGVGYSCQLIDRVPTEPWDRPLHALVTERGVHTFSP